MRRSRSVACAALFVTAVAACKRSAPPSPPGESAPGESAPVVLDAAPPPRCELGAASVSVTEAGERRLLEIGDATATPTAIAVGVARSIAGKLHASIALVAPDVASVRMIDLGLLAADAPPPKPLVRGGDVLALYAAPGAPTKGADAGAHRVTPLVLARVAEPKADVIATVLPLADESLACDAIVLGATALVAWDEDAPGERGVIKVAPIAIDGARGAPVTSRAVSPDTSDAEAPRLAPRVGGAWIAWTARRPEPAADAAAPEAKIEAPAERRVFQWIELLALDDHGAPLGTVRRLTPASGHVGAFDLAARGPTDLDVLVRDDDQAIEGAGGRITRFVVHGDAVDAPIAIVADGAGRGSIDLLVAPAPAPIDPWLFFADTNDRTRVLPLGAAATTASATIEPALDSARPLALTLSPSSGPVTMLAAFPNEEKQLRAVTCRR